MTISTNFQASTATALRFSMPQASMAAATNGTSAAPPTQDRVTLSSPSPAPSDTGVESPVTPPPATPTPSAAGGKTDALLAALDGDDDGAVTREEFSEAAAALLRRDGPPRANDEGRGRRGLPGLERRLEKAFARLDGNRDGSLTGTELSAALGTPEPGVEHAPEAAAASSVSVSYVRVTTVRIAVQRYTSLQAAPSSPTYAPVVPATAEPPLPSSNGTAVAASA